MPAKTKGREVIKVFTGANAYAVRQAVSSLIDKAVAAHGHEAVERVDVAALKPADMPQLLMGASLFSSDKLVIFEDLSQNKVVWSSLDTLLTDVPQETTILLVEPSPDKRTKAYKWLQKNADVQEFTELDERAAVQWLQTVSRADDVDIHQDAARYLVQYVGIDQWRLKGELDKLLLADKPITKELIQDIVEPNPQATAFELLDAAFGRDDETLERLLRIVSRSEDPYKFFGLLASQVFALVAVKAAGSRRQDEIAKDLGLHPFVVRKVGSLATRLDQGALDTVVETLARGDEQLKSSGTDPWELIGRMLHMMSAK